MSKQDKKLSVGDKPREFWVIKGEDLYGDLAYTIKQNTPEDQTHVIEYSAFEAMRERAERAEAELWVAKDSQLRTYDGMAQKADRADDLEKENAELHTRIKKLRKALRHYSNKAEFEDRGLGITNESIAVEALTADDALDKE